MNMMRGNEIGRVGWVGCVCSALTGRGMFYGLHTRACSPGYNMAPLQGDWMGGVRLGVVRLGGGCWGEECRVL